MNGGHLIYYFIQYKNRRIENNYAEFYLINVHLFDITASKQIILQSEKCFVQILRSADVEYTAFRVTGF